MPKRGLQRRGRPTQAPTERVPKPEGSAARCGSSWDPPHSLERRIYFGAASVGVPATTINWVVSRVKGTQVTTVPSFMVALTLYPNDPVGKSIGMVQNEDKKKPAGGMPYPQKSSAPFLP